MCQCRRSIISCIQSDTILWRQVKGQLWYPRFRDVYSSYKPLLASLAQYQLASSLRAVSCRLTRFLPWAWHHRVSPDVGSPPWRHNLVPARRAPRNEPSPRAPRLPSSARAARTEPSEPPYTARAVTSRSPAETRAGLRLPTRNSATSWTLFDQPAERSA